MLISVSATRRNVAPRRSLKPSYDEILKRRAKDREAAARKYVSNPPEHKDYVQELIKEFHTENRVPSAVKDNPNLKEVFDKAYKGQLARLNLWMDYKHGDISKAEYDSKKDALDKSAAKTTKALEDATKDIHKDIVAKAKAHNDRVDAYNAVIDGLYEKLAKTRLKKDQAALKELIRKYKEEMPIDKVIAAGSAGTKKSSDKKAEKKDTPATKKDAKPVGKLKRTPQKLAAAVKASPAIAAKIKKIDDEVKKLRKDLILAYRKKMAAKGKK